MDDVGGLAAPIADPEPNRLRAEALIGEARRGPRAELGARIGIRQVRVVIPGVGAGPGRTGRPRSVEVDRDRRVDRAPWRTWGRRGRRTGRPGARPGPRGPAVVYVAGSIGGEHLECVGAVAQRRVRLGRAARSPGAGVETALEGRSRLARAEGETRGGRG